MKNEIRIIKKNDRVVKSESKQTKKSSKREQSHETMTTIAGWVRDIQNRRTVDPKRAFHNLFNDPLVGTN